MSFLDIDERILALAEKIDIVISPIVDPKVFPERVDVTLVEGAVSNTEDVHRAKLVRERSNLVIAFGDCAITGNVPAMRNTYDVRELFERAYVENATFPPTPAERRAKRPVRLLPPLEPRARPLHEIVKVDLFLPGCPPPADAIHFVIAELLEGRVANPSQLTRFGK
jgi:NAD-reducing hydrogenase small subunit